MTDVITKAEARRAELEAEIERLDVFISMYHSLSGSAAAPQRRSRSQPRSDGDAPRRGSRHALLIERAKELIVERGEPMTRTQLVDALEASGMEVGGDDKSKNLGTIIWRAKAFDNVGDGYWPKGIPRQLTPIEAFGNPEVRPLNLGDEQAHARP